MAGPLEIGAAFGPALTTATKTMTNLIALKQQAEHQRALEANQAGMLKIAQDRNEQEMKIKGFQERELAKKEADYEAPMDITVNPLFLKLPEDQRANALKFFQSQGYVDERGVGKTGKIMEGVKRIETTKPLFEQFMGPVVEAQKNNLLDLEKQAIENPNKPKIQEQLKAARNQYRMAIGTYDKHISEIEKQEAAMKLAEEATARAESVARINQEQKVAPTSWHVIADKGSKTGYSYQNLNNPTQMVKNAPPPASTSAAEGSWAPTGYVDDEGNPTFYPTKPPAGGKIPIKSGQPPEGKKLNPKPAPLTPIQELMKKTLDKKQKAGEAADLLTKQFPPGKYKGREIQDTETGVMFKSDGKTWSEVK